MNSVLGALDKALSGGFSEGARFLLALSGGMDSMVLLDALLKRLPAEKLVCCHLNHLYRGQEADRDEAFVRASCDRLDLELFVRRASMEDCAQAHKISLEEAGRVLRRSFFEAIAKETACVRILTAHHANDQAETLLMRLMRGSGINGLAGIASDDGTYLRPLLSVTRAQIETYAQVHKVPFQEDVSNMDLGFTRNRIRHQLIPDMEAFNPRLVSTLAETADRLRVDADLLENFTDQVFRTLAKQPGDGLIVDRAGFFSQPLAMQDRLIRKAVGLMSDLQDFGSLETERFRQTAYLSSGKRALWKDLEMRVEGDQLFFGKHGLVHILEPTHLQEGPNDLGPLGILTLTLGRYKGGCNSKAVSFDLDRLQGPLICRTRREGDRFKPFGARGSKSVSDYFTDEKIPQSLRDRALIIQDERDILWIAGYRRADKAPVTSGTRQILTIHYEEPT